MMVSFRQWTGGVLNLYPVFSWISCKRCSGIFFFGSSAVGFEEGCSTTIKKPCNRGHGRRDTMPCIEMRAMLQDVLSMFVVEVQRSRTTRRRVRL